MWTLYVLRSFLSLGHTQSLLIFPTDVGFLFFNVLIFSVWLPRGENRKKTVKKVSGPLNPHLGGGQRLQQGAGAARMTSAPSVCTLVISHQSPDPPSLEHQVVFAHGPFCKPSRWGAGSCLRTESWRGCPFTVGGFSLKLEAFRVPEQFHQRDCPAVAVQVGRQIPGASCITIFQNFLWSKAFCTRVGNSWGLKKGSSQHSWTQEPHSLWYQNPVYEALTWLQLDWENRAQNGKNSWDYGRCDV